MNAKLETLLQSFSTTQQNYYPWCIGRLRTEITQLSQGDCIAVCKEICSENQSSNGASTGKKKDCDHFGSRLFQCLPLFKLGNNYRCDIENYYGHSEKCATKLLGKNV